MTLFDDYHCYSDFFSTYLSDYYDYPDYHVDCHFYDDNYVNYDNCDYFDDYHISLSSYYHSIWTNMKIIH